MSKVAAANTQLVSLQQHATVLRWCSMYVACVFVRAKAPKLAVGSLECLPGDLDSARKRRVLWRVPTGGHSSGKDSKLTFSICNWAPSWRRKPVRCVSSRDSSSTATAA